MNGSRFVARHLLRRHWRATALLGLGLGLAAAIPVTAWGVARRTDAAFPAFRTYSLQGLDSLRGAAFCPPSVDASSGCPAYLPTAEQAVLATSPGIAATTREAAVITSVSTDAKPEPRRTIAEGYYDPPIVLQGQFVSTTGRARVVAGRMADFDSPDEVMVNDAFLASRSVKLGDAFRLAIYRADEFDEAGEGAQTPSRGFRDVRIVGVLRQPSDLQTADPEGGLYSDFGHVMIGPGVMRSFDNDVATYGVIIGIVPADPDTDIEGIVSAAFPGRPVQWFTIGNDQGGQLDAIERSIHLQSNAVRAFAITSAIAALIFGGQTLMRQVRRELAIRDTLAALGLGRADVRRIAGLRIAPVAAIAALTCAVVSVVASPIGPIGIARKAELHGGIHLDWLSVLVGTAAGATSVLLITVLVVRRARARPTTPAAARLATFASSISPAARAGLAYLRPSGTERSGSAQRTAVASCVTAAGSVVAAAVLITSLHTLLGHPARYGFAWDAQVGNFGASAQSDQGVAQVRAVPHLNAAALLYTEDASIAHEYRALLAFEHLDGFPDVPPTVSSGRLPADDHEIALAAPLADSLHKRIGDTVDVTVSTPAGDQTIPLTLVGNVVLSALFPPIDPKTGVLVHSSLLKELSTPQNVVVSVDPHYRREALNDLKAAFPNSFTEPIPPLDVQNLRRIESLPSLLAGVIAVLAAAALLHALFSIVRAGRHDLTMLRVLGARRSQARSSVLWSATALVAPAIVVGAAAGWIGGELGWRAIADRRGLAQDPTVRPLWIVVAVVTSAVVANLVAWLPARRTTSASPAAILRAE